MVGGLIIRIDKIRACAVDRRTRKSSSGHNGRVAAELIQVEHVETHAGNGASPRPHTKRPTELFLAHRIFLFLFPTAVSSSFNS